MMCRRSRIALGIVAFVVSACSHEGSSSTTSVTAASIPSGRSTDARASDDPTLRLAGEVCAREAACNHIGYAAPYRSEEACVDDQRTVATTQFLRWGCTPGRTHAGFEECLAAVRSEHCEASLPPVDLLAPCRSTNVCTAHD